MFLNLNNKKKITIFMIAGIAAILCISTTCVFAYKSFLKKNNFEPPEWVLEFEKDMVKTSQEVRIGDYKVRLVGVHYENDQKLIDSIKKLKSEQAQMVYFCKFEVRNPKVNFRRYIKRRWLGDKWFGEYYNLMIRDAYEASGMNAITEYFQLKDDVLDVYVCLQIDKDDIFRDKEYYSTWCECLYVQRMEKADDYGIEDMSGVFNLNISGREKKYKYSKAPDTKITVTEQAIYFNGNDFIDTESIVLHMKNGISKDIVKELHVSGGICEEGIVEYGEYKPDDTVKTYTRLIRFYDGTGIDNLDYIEINGEKLEEQQ